MVEACWSCGNPICSTCFLVLRNHTFEDKTFETSVGWGTWGTTKMTSAIQRVAEEGLSAACQVQLDSKASWVSSCGSVLLGSERLLTCQNGIRWRHCTSCSHVWFDGRQSYSRSGFLRDLIVRLYLVFNGHKFGFTVKRCGFTMIPLDQLAFQEAKMKMLEDVGRDF